MLSKSNGWKGKLTMNTKCTCTHTTCDKHGNCKDCMDFHTVKPYCKSSKLRKAVFRLQFKIYDKNN